MPHQTGQCGQRSVDLQRSSEGQGLGMPSSPNLQRRLPHFACGTPHCNENCLFGVCAGTLRRWPFVAIRHHSRSYCWTFQRPAHLQQPDRMLSGAQVTRSFPSPVLQCSQCRNPSAAAWESHKGWFPKHPAPQHARNAILFRLQ